VGEVTATTTGTLYRRGEPSVKVNYLYTSESSRKKGTLAELRYYVKNGIYYTYNTHNVAITSGL